MKLISELLYMAMICDVMSLMTIRQNNIILYKLYSTHKMHAELEVDT